MKQEVLDSWRTKLALVSACLVKCPHNEMQAYCYRDEAYFTGAAILQVDLRHRQSPLFRINSFHTQLYSENIFCIFPGLWL